MVSVDLDSTVWLEGFLRTLPLPLLVISHDREFLDQVGG